MASEDKLSGWTAQQPPLRYSRRNFLGRSVRSGSGVLTMSALSRLVLPAVGGSTLAGASSLLAACSSSPVAPVVVALFSPDRVLAAGRPERIPFAIVSPDATVDAGEVALPPDDGTVQVKIQKDGTTLLETSVAGRVVDHDHVDGSDPEHQHANILRYYALRATLDEPGIYDLTIGVEGAEAELIIQLFDPAEIDLPLVGDPFPSITTPTFDDPSAVDRLCTRVEPCPFHAVSADQTLAAGKPMALLVATPAFCSTAYCGPVLETLITGSSEHSDIEFIHVEVYENTLEVDQNFADPRIRLAPAVIDLGLGFEPSLFLVSADGILVDRIDNVFDASELSEALGALRP